jgi:hypothetical protein
VAGSDVHVDGGGTNQPQRGRMVSIPRFFAPDF